MRCRQFRRHIPPSTGSLVTFQSRAVERGSSFLNAGIGCVLLSRSDANRKKRSPYLQNGYTPSDCPE